MRGLKIALMMMVAFWAFIAVQGNLAEMGMTYDQVRHVTTMPMFKPGEGPPWASDNALLIGLGVALIVLGKLAGMVAAGYGAYRMHRARHADSATFNAAKQWAVLGCGITIGWLFLGFTTIGENFYLMFLDEVGRHSAESAFRYGAMTALMMIFVAQPD